MRFHYRHSIPRDHFPDTSNGRTGQRLSIMLRVRIFARLNTRFSISRVCLRIYQLRNELPPGVVPASPVMSDTRIAALGSYTYLSFSSSKGFRAVSRNYQVTLLSAVAEKSSQITPTVNPVADLKRYGLRIIAQMPDR